MDEEKLKPCPICGKTDTLRIMEGDRVVERAAREMVKKGFNKFFEKQEVTHD